MVVALHETQRTVRIESLDMARRAQDIVSQCVAMVEDVLKVVKYEFGRVILIALYFLQYHATLLVNLMLWECAAKHDIGEQFKGTHEVFLQECRIHHRLLLVSKGIEVAPHILHSVEDMPRPALPGTLEEHVLHEVGKALLVRPFITCAYIKGVATIDHRRRRLRMYDAQPIGQDGSIIGCLHSFFNLTSPFQSAKIRISE